MWTAELTNILKEQVRDGSRRRNSGEIKKIFEKFGKDIDQGQDKPNRILKLIEKADLPRALDDLNIHLDDSQAKQLFDEMDIDFNAGLDEKEFERAVHAACERMPGPYELWTRSLPVAQILADALPKPTNASEEDSHLRFVSNLNDHEIEEVVAAFAEGVSLMLKESCTKLREAYEAIKKKKDEEERNPTKKGKFNVFTANCGTIRNFHEGMTERVGVSQPPSPRALARERAGHSVDRFTGRNRGAVTESTEHEAALSGGGGGGGEG